MENEYEEIYEETYEENYEITEPVEETVQGVDTGAENDVISSDDTLESSLDSSTIGDSEQTLEELLREYFAGSREASLDPEEDETILRSVEGASEIDYTEILEELLQYSQDSVSLNSSLYEYYQEYDENNNLQSGVDNISLTNYLLLLVFIGLLASSTIGLLMRFT